MGNSLRCCLACLLPCGALDLIRVVHITGHVDQFSHPLPASSVLAANPHHVLTRPSSHSPTGAVVVPPDSHLRRGHIYFLVPAPSPPGKAAANKRRAPRAEPPPEAPAAALEEAPPEPERKATHRRRRSGRIGAWKQQLECIEEDD